MSDESKRRSQITKDCAPNRDEMYVDLLPYEMERSEFAALLLKGDADRKLASDRKDLEEGWQFDYSPAQRHADAKTLETQIEEGILTAKAAPCNNWGHLWRPTPEAPEKKKFKSPEEAKAYFATMDRARRCVTVKLDPDPFCEKACAEFKDIRVDVLASDRRDHFAAHTRAHHMYPAESAPEENPYDRED